MCVCVSVCVTRSVCVCVTVCVCVYKWWGRSVKNPDRNAKLIDLEEVYLNQYSVLISYGPHGFPPSFFLFVLLLNVGTLQPVTQYVYR